MKEDNNIEKNQELENPKEDNPEIEKEVEDPKDKKEKVKKDKKEKDKKKKDKKEKDKKKKDKKEKDKKKKDKKEKDKKEKDKNEKDKKEKDKNEKDKKEKDKKEKDKKEKDKNEKVKKEKTKKPKSKLKRIIILVLVMLVLICCGIGIYAFSFPLTIKYTMQGENITSTGCFEDLEIQVKSNQLIKNVYYGINVDNRNNIENYTKVASNVFKFNENIVIPEFNIPVGENKIYIYVETIFGQTNIKRMKVEYSVGYTSEPELDSIIELENYGVGLISNELLVEFKEGTSQKKIDELVEKYEGEVVGQIYLINTYQIRFEGNGTEYIEELKNKIEQEEIVQSVTLNISFEMDIDETPNDTEFDSWTEDKIDGNNWGLEAMNLPEAWEYNDQINPIKVGVIDSVLDYEHVDLKINENHVIYAATKDFPTMNDLIEFYQNGGKMTNETDAYKNHGTHCTGIIGAKANNELGICGVNWQADMYFASFWYTKYAQSQENEEQKAEKIGSNILFTNDLIYLVTSGCRVINISVGTKPVKILTEEEQEKLSYQESLEYKTYIQYEEEVSKIINAAVTKLDEENRDFLITKAAGNESEDASTCILNRALTKNEQVRNHTLIVANVSSSQNWKYKKVNGIKTIFKLNSTSNYGTMIDIAAPGTDIYSTITDDEYGLMTGTSMAAPMVAGVASMVYGVNPNLKCTEVKDIIINTATEYASRSKDKNVYRVVNAQKAVEEATKGEYIPIENTEKFGYITGVIQNAIDKNPIKKSIVYMTNVETEEIFAFDATDGRYYFALSTGTYNMKVTWDGYVLENIYNIVIEEDLITYNVLVNLVKDSEEKATVTGRTKNAINVQSIPNAKMTFRLGINNKDGEIVATTTSDEYGKYTVELGGGNYTVYVEAENYLSDYSTVLAIGGQTTTEQDCTLTPVLQPGEVRAVLKWGETPRDLDSHLVGPTPEENKKFHIWYSNKNYYYESVQYDNLDVDDTSSYGPETTSVYVGLNGTYSYYVHDYTNNRSTASEYLAKSEANVKIYVYGKSEPIEFNVPNEAGTLWKVCDFKITDGNVEVIPVNTMEYGTVTTN